MFMHCVCGKVFPNWYLEFFKRLFDISINIDFTHISFNYIIGRSNGQNVATHLAIIDDRLVTIMVMGWECTYSFRYVTL
jgi:hypothetical protein